MSLPSINSDDMSDSFPAISSVLWERSAQSPAITLHSSSALPRLHLSENAIRRHIGRLITEPRFCTSEFELVGAISGMLCMYPQLI